jgi:hypothetical protein
VFACTKLTAGGYSVQTLMGSAFITPLFFEWYRHTMHGPSTGSEARGSCFGGAGFIAAMLSRFTLQFTDGTRAPERVAYTTHKKPFVRSLGSSCHSSHT